MDLNKLIGGKYKTLVAIGDIHGEIGPLLSLAKDLIDDETFVVFMGDLINGGDYSHDVVDFVLSVLNADHGALCIGNHDRKMYRYATGKTDKLNAKYAKTLYNLGANVTDFFDDLIDLIEHDNTDYTHVLNNISFGHAAIPPIIWGGFSEKLNKKNKEFAVYGPKLGDVDWVDFIPDGHIGVVGHDRFVFGKDETTPLELSNDNGGIAYFIDTGCGKNGINVLTGAVFDLNVALIDKPILKSYA